MSTREQIHSMIDNLNDEQLNALFILLDSMKTRKSEEKTESMKAFERLEKLHRSIPDIDEKKELDEYRKEKYEV